MSGTHLIIYIDNIIWLFQYRIRINPRALLEGLYWLRGDMVCDIEKAISYTLYYIHIPQVDVFYVT